MNTLRLRASAVLGFFLGNKIDLMNENNEPKRFFPNEEFDEGQVFIEVPAEQKPQPQEKIPSGYDPMGEIYLRGRAYRSLARGRIPWWVIISSWLIFGSSALIIIVVTLPDIIFYLSDVFSPSPKIDRLKQFFIFLSFMPALGFSALPFFVLWRGTLAKISSTKRRSR